MFSRISSTCGNPVFLTDVQDPLFGRVLPGVPVLPVFELLVSVLVLAEHHHDDALSGRKRLLMEAEVESKGFPGHT